MNNIALNSILKSDTIDITGSNASVRRQYEKPVLLCYGDVRDVTLGPTPGFGESGCQCDRRPGSSISCPVPPSPCIP